MSNMKKFLLAGVMALFAISCSSVKQAETAQTQRSEVLKLKGDWQITSVNYEKGYKIKPFDEGADAQCFVGSQWKFVSNNNKGNMALTKANCVAFSSPITWFVNDKGQFVLKVLDAGIKAKKVRDGYVLNLANQTATSFQLIDKIDVGGKMTDVVYQFQKVN